LERKVARENKELQDAAAVEYHHKENFITAEYCDKQGYIRHGRLQTQASSRTLQL
jgi:hypothetical protein